MRGYILLFLLIGITLIRPSSGVQHQRKNGICDDKVPVKKRSRLHTTDNLTLTSPYDYVCRRGRNQFLPNPDTDFSSYFVCSVEGDSLQFRCPHGFKFDSKSCSCTDKVRTNECLTSNSSQGCNWKLKDVHPFAISSYVRPYTNFSNSQAVYTEICAELGEGWFPDVLTDCSYFFHCTSIDDKQPVVLPCPSGMKFSSSQCMCVDSLSEPCGPLIPSKACHIPEFDGCKYLDPGIYVSYMKNCTRYFMCSPTSDDTYFFDCPTGQKFSIDNCTCVDESLVDCTYCSSLKACNRPTPAPTTIPPTSTTTTKPTTTTTTTKPTTTTTTPTTTTTTPTTTTTTPTTTTTTPTTTTTTPTTTTTTPTTTTTTTKPTTTTPTTTTTTTTKPTTTTTTPTTTTTTTTKPTTTTTTPTTTTTTTTKPTTTTTTPTTTTTTPPTPPPDCCKGKATALYPYYESDCQCYYSCTEGIVEPIDSYMCPPYFKFDIHTCSCLPSYMVVCDASSENHGCVPQPPSTISTPKPPTTPYSDFCNGKGPGYYADLSRSCEWYFVCFGTSDTVQFHCPSNLRFNHFTCQCEYPDTVLCTVFDEVPCYQAPRTDVTRPTTVTTPSPDPEHYCEHKVPGYYIDTSKDCQFYYLCVPGNPRPYIFQCDVPYKFNITAGKCVRSDDYHC